MKHPDDPVAIAIRDVHLSFGGLKVLDGLDLDVHDGEIVGLVGPNGAGKTSLLNCVNRIYQHNSGSISLYGQDINNKRPDEVAHLGVARTFQTFIGFKNTKVRDLILLGRHVRLRPTFISYLIGLPVLNGDERRERHGARRYLDLVGLTHLEGAHVGELSYAQTKLLDLARALASEPRVLLLDEPASGLSAPARLEMTQVLRQIQSDLKITVLIVEHDMELISRTCDTVVVLKDGATLASGAPATVLRDPLVVEGLMGQLAAK